MRGGAAQTNTIPVLLLSGQQLPLVNVLLRRAAFRRRSEGSCYAIAAARPNLVRGSGQQYFRQSQP